MAALLKDDEYVATTLSVRPEGLNRLLKAIENPKAPPSKLVEMMRRQKVVKSSK